MFTYVFRKKIPYKATKVPTLCRLFFDVLATLPEQKNEMGGDAGFGSLLLYRHPPG
jgi:hypothetical protein